jgi:hypothetical protein
MTMNANTTPYDWMPEARAAAAQCWCQPETSNTDMDAVLAEVMATRIAGWMREAAQYAENAAYWRGEVETLRAEVSRLQHEVIQRNVRAMAGDAAVAERKKLEWVIADRKRKWRTDMAIAVCAALAAWLVVELLVAWGGT